MSYSLRLSDRFEKEFKKLFKKYPSLKNEISVLGQELKEDPFIGKPLGMNCYKIRLSIASKGKGKSGGARVITFVRVVESTVYLLSIYDKSEKENISDAEILDILNSVGE